MFLLFLSLIPTVLPLRLLFYVPTLSYSHVAFNAGLAHKLVEAGHHVTMIQAVVDESVSYNSSHFEVIRKYVGVAPGEAKSLLWTNPGPFDEASPLDPKILWKFIRVSNLFVNICGALMEDLLFLEEIRARRFDVGFLEQYDYCGFGFFSAAGIPRVSWLSATLLFAPQSIAMGVSQPVSYHPELLLPSNAPLTFITRAHNLVVSLVTSSLIGFTQWRQNFVFKGRSDLPRSFDLGEASSKMSQSLLVNTSPLFDLPYPQSAEFRNIASVTVVGRQEQLGQEWRALASRGQFVLVSFGSIAEFSDMPPPMRSSFLETFALYPNMTFFLKWRQPPPSLPSNVFTFDWLPQKALIAHRNFRAMVTHGGWSSISEVVSAGRPLVLIPLFADHWRNSRVVAEKEVGLVLDKKTVTADRLSSALDEVIFDPRYTLQASKISSMLRNPSPASVTRQLNYSVAKKSSLRMTRPRSPTEHHYLLLLILLMLLTLMSC